ncbi:hypothetical protein ACKI14_48305, partial [Streptomyces turgidiscabies]|uniref:hypothetical protein n=1 Tax=Streptomyces turgidiscabies TaxID=85558 RepID=UPI0038F5E0E1
MKPLEQIAWAAGLFEGEGCITISNQQRGYQQPRLKLTMTDDDVVRRFGEIVEVGQFCIQRFKNPLYKEQLCWYTGKREDVVKVIDMLIPFFGERRKAKALEVRAICLNS